MWTLVPPLDVKIDVANAFRFAVSVLTQRIRLPASRERAKSSVWGVAVTSSKISLAAMPVTAVPMVAAMAAAVGPPTRTIAPDATKGPSYFSSPMSAVNTSFQGLRGLPAGSIES